MVLSRLVLRAQYTQKHLVGVALCLTGLALTIISDLEGDEEEAAYPHALYGDLLCIFGAALYAGSNVMQEDFVKNHDRVRTYVRMRVVLRRTLHTRLQLLAAGSFFFFFLRIIRWLRVMPFYIFTPSCCAFFFFFFLRTRRERYKKIHRLFNEKAQVRLCLGQG